VVRLVLTRNLEGGYSSSLVRQKLRKSSCVGKEYSQIRPHSALDYRPPAPEAIISLTLT